MMCWCAVVAVTVASMDPSMQVEGGWNLSSSFPVDSVGEYTLRLTRQVDVGKLRHISTRRSSEYEVEIPSMEVGFHRVIKSEKASF